MGLDKLLGVFIIVLSFYFGIKMYVMSRDPRKDIDLNKDKSLKSKKKVD